MHRRQRLVASCFLFTFGPNLPNIVLAGRLAICSSQSHTVHHHYTTITRYPCMSRSSSHHNQAGVSHAEERRPNSIRSMRHGLTIVATRHDSGNRRRASMAAIVSAFVRRSNQLELKPAATEGLPDAMKLRDECVINCFFFPSTFFFVGLKACEVWSASTSRVPEGGPHRRTSLKPLLRGTARFMTHTGGV